MKVLFDVLFYIIFYTTVGGLWLGWSIVKFQEGRYFRFGLGIMLFAFEAFCLLNLVITGGGG